jgi:hypothetical protein
MKHSMQHQANNGFKSFLFLMAASLLMNCSKAQMSPFDGSYTIVIKVKNQVDGDVQFELREINASTDSCSFGGYRNLRFQRPEEVLIQNRNQNMSWEFHAREYAKDALFMAPGYYAVVLNSSERSCMIPQANEYIYRDRYFQVVAIQNNSEKVVAEVPQERIYNLSLMRGKWDQILSIKIILP